MSMSMLILRIWLHVWKEIMLRWPVVLDNYRKVKEKYDYITVEGSGGILCPICFDEARIGLTDIIDEMELDCILVADAGLGTINSVVLTYEYMKQKYEYKRNDF